MPTPTNWQPAYKVSITVNGVQPPITDAEYTENAGEFDATVIGGPTNANGLLCEQIGNDVVSTSLRFNAILDPANVNSLAVGVPYAATVAFTNEQSHAGTIRITSRGKTIAVKGAYKIAYQGKFTALVSGQ